MDERQEGIVVSQESTWDGNSLEIKGNFSWGFINKQDDTEEGDAALVDNKDNLVTIGSKIFLKNLDLKIKGGDFVCIIGVGACGKSSLL